MAILAEIIMSDSDPAAAATAGQDDTVTHPGDDSNNTGQYNAHVGISDIFTFSVK